MHAGGTNLGSPLVSASTACACRGDDRGGGDLGWPGSRTLGGVYDPEPALIPYPEERSRTIWRGRRFGVLEPVS